MPARESVASGGWSVPALAAAASGGPAGLLEEPLVDQGSAWGLAGADLDAVRDEESDLFSQPRPATLLVFIVFIVFIVLILKENFKTKR